MIETIIAIAIKNAMCNDETTITRDDVQIAYANTQSIECTSHTIYIIVLNIVDECEYATFVATCVNDDIMTITYEFDDETKFINTY